MKNILFETTTYETWINKIKKDLKSPDLDQVTFCIEESLNVSPFSTSSQTTHFQPTECINSMSQWVITDSFTLNSDTKDNSNILSALKGGVNGLRLIVEDGSTNINYDAIFNDIYLDIIDVQMVGSPEQLVPFFNYLNKRKLNKILKGSVESWPNSFDNYDFPHLRLAFNSENDAIYSAQLEDLYTQLIKYFNSFENKEDQERAAQRIQLNVKLSNDFLSNIAFLKAARILWVHLMEAFDLLYSPLVIFTESKIEKSTPFEIKCIYGTVQLISSILGSANGSYINLSAEENTAENSKRSTGINLHHLALLEAKLRSTDDPLKGSYFIENAANAMAGKVWNKLTHKD